MSITRYIANREQGKNSNSNVFIRIRYTIYS